MRVVCGMLCWLAEQRRTQYCMQHRSWVNFMEPVYWDLLLNESFTLLLSRVQTDLAVQ